MRRRYVYIPECRMMIEPYVSRIGRTIPLGTWRVAIRSPDLIYGHSYLNQNTFSTIQSQLRIACALRPHTITKKNSRRLYLDDWRNSYSQHYFFFVSVSVFKIHYHFVYL